MSAPGREPGPGEARASAGLDEEADRWLVGRVRDGDRGAYEELVRRHRDRIYRIALRMLGNPADADDVAQEVVIQLWTALTGFGGTSAFTTWLYRVVVNRCLNHRRGQRTHDELADADHPGVPGPERRVLAGEELQAGLRAISGLPEDQRVSLVLVQLEGLSYREAATVTKTSEATVRGRLARARATLMSEMKDWT
ncbi:RNA polymerase sigma factor [Actinomycetospora aeridis]|uniref:RNA polymerase sigma factor n=1 Tax=Actinomycetospora aeridis TaxID=3129231 RepID=A0ABU8NHF9_9PSEU